MTWTQSNAKWTEKEMQLALFEWLERRNRTLILPNFTPSRWHECDMFSLTKSLYFHEIEVKVSRRDFQADKNKREKHRILSGDGYTEDERRINRIGMPRHRIPDRPPRTFVYACPAGLLSVEDVPEYAGLIHIKRYDRTHCATRYTVDIVKKPPTIRGAGKLSSEQVFQITNNLWYRYANEWKKRVELILHAPASP